MCATRGGDRLGAVRDGIDYRWRERPLGGRAHPQCCVTGEPRRPIRAALWADGTSDFVHGPRIALHEDLWADARAVGDGLGRAARMGGEEPARHLPDADHRRGCAEFADDRLPVPAIAVLPGDRWRRRIDPGFRRARPRLPAKLAPGNEQGAGLLLGTGESLETPMVSQMEDFTSSRAFRVAGAKAF